MEEKKNEPQAICEHCRDREEFVTELESLLNAYNYDTITGIPDFILAEFVMKNLEAFVAAQDDTSHFFREIDEEDQKRKENAS